MLLLLQNLHSFCTNRKLDHTLGSLLGLAVSAVVNGSFSNEKD